MDGFARTILERGESVIPGEMGRRDMQIVEAIYESARTKGRPADVAS